MSKLFCLIMFLLFSLDASSQDLAALASSTESCDFYLSLEAQRQCVLAPVQPSNYLIGYGYKYCSMYLYLSQNWNGALRQWTEDTLVCLKTALLNHHHEQETCKELESFAFNSHPDCYINSGFCSLSTVDKIRIIRHLKCLDILHQPKKSLAQAIAVLNRCGVDVNLAAFADKCSLF